MRVPYTVMGKSSDGRFTIFVDTLSRCVSCYPNIDYAHLNSFRLSSCLYSFCIMSDTTCNFCPCKL